MRNPKRLIRDFWYSQHAFVPVFGARYIFVESVMKFTIDSQITSDSQVYFFTSSGFGGGNGFKLAGLGVCLPSPICSHGERDSKLLEER